MAYDKPKWDAWQRLRITQDVINAAQDVAATEIGKKAEYWEKVVKFLSELSQRKYIDLTSKQITWARSIKMDLELDHSYKF